MITKAEAEIAIVASTRKVPRERIGSSFRSVGTWRRRVASSQIDKPKNVAIRAISQPEIPRSTKLWTEKSASTPDRVRNVPYSTDR